MSPLCVDHPVYPQGQKVTPPRREGPEARWEVVCCSQQVTSVVALPLQGRGVNNALGLLN
jgi:hypothetical protein